MARPQHPPAVLRKPRGGRNGAAPDSCVIADSPHSGRRYPRDFKHICDRKTLRQAEDAYLDRLLDFLPRLGIPLVQATFPRSYIDPNRAENAPTLIRRYCSPRHPVEIYAGPLAPHDVFNRVAQYYRPYHDMVAQLRKDTRARHGRVVHLNFHSLPSELVPGAGPYPHDIVIGTREGKSCAPALADKLRRLFEAKGYRVAMDAPGFSGAEMLRRSGHPQAHAHALQVEINRALYLDENSLRLNARAPQLKADLRDILRDFRDYCDAPAFAPAPAPAEGKPPRAARKPSR